MKKSQRAIQIYRDIAIISFNTGLLLLILEIGAWGILKLSSRTQTVNRLELGKKMHYLAREHFSKEENDRVFFEAKASETLKYAPWVQFALEDYKGKYVNTQKFMRKTTPRHSLPDTTQATIVFFKGVSSMYGLGVTDKVTIPAVFSQICRQKQIPVMVYNHGLPAYFSYQEYILLINLISQGHKPDKVIFLDGLNDILGLSATYYQAPFFTKTNEQLLSPQATSRKNLIKKLVRQTNIYKLLFKAPPNTAYQLPTGVSKAAVVDKVVTNYQQLIGSVKQLCAQYDIDCYFFVQPVPFYNYPNRKNDPICAKEDLGIDARFAQSYPALKEGVKIIDKAYFLGDMLAQEKGYPFIDKIHYTPDFCKKIAQRMFQKIIF